MSASRGAKVTLAQQQLHILKRLTEKGECTIIECSEGLPSQGKSDYAKVARTANIIAAMHRSFLITKHPHPTKERMVSIAITSKGKEYLFSLELEHSHKKTPC